MAVLPDTRDSGDDPRGIHPPDTAVSVIGDIEVAGSIYGNAYGYVQQSLDRRAAIPAVGPLIVDADAPDPRDGGDGPRSIHPSDAVVPCVGD